jgi:hypothetical protein
MSVHRIVFILALIFCQPCLSQDGTGKESWVFPRERVLPNGRLIVHAPQIVSWDNFEDTEMLMALEYFPNNSDKHIFASASISGDTEVDLDNGIVTFSSPTFTEVKIASDESTDYSEDLQQYIKKDVLEIPLDVFLVSLAQDVLDENSDAGDFNPQPPAILVKETPTLLLFVNGKVRLEDLESTGLKIAINANWPLVQEPGSGTYFLLYQNFWLSAPALDGPFSIAESAPKNIGKIDSSGLHKEFQVTTQPDVKSYPQVVTVTEPTELIVMDGTPELENIPGADGLQFVSNTQSPLFYYQDRWYFLTAGRWFITDDLTADSWKLQVELPEAFAGIPEAHGMAYVRVSIAGTLEARTAIVEASLPSKKVVEKGAQLDLENDFDGEPSFQPIDGTQVARAINTSHDIIEYQNNYYLCYEGAWYQANTPIGPWIAAYRVPDAVYKIPPSSPSYPVTSVQVASSTPSTIVYSAAPSYSTSVYVYYGVPVYGTGWYYPPYWGLYYYPYRYSYGYGSFYMPRTGAYGTRSVWYGPYGGYSYNQYTNPRTGRSGYVETAWDSDEWASYGESYNPRTQIYQETSRYYDDDRERFSMEREASRGDKTIATEREIDINDGWSTTERKTSEGGSSYVERHRQEDGSWTADGSFQTGDGRSGTISGEISDGKRRTEITGSDGGKLVSGGDGQNRGFVGESGSGDLYAGKNGNVYKKGEDGWSKYNGKDGNWQQVQRDANNREKSRQSVQRQNQATTAQQRVPSKDWSSRYGSNKQLSRDAQARQRGYSQFRQRSSYQGRNQSGRSMGGRTGRSMGGGRGRGRR